MKLLMDDERKCLPWINYMKLDTRLFLFSRTRIIIRRGNSKSQKELTMFICTSCKNNRIYQNLHFCGLDLYVRVEMVFCVFFRFEFRQWARRFLVSVFGIDRLLLG